LSDVRLEISVKPRYLIFGQNFSVRGSLTAENGNPLGGRRIILHAGGKIYSLKTSTNGSYLMECSAKEYSKIKVFAEYIPRGKDAGLYSYAMSDVVVVNVTYYVPPLNLTLSKDRVLPGETLTMHVGTIPGVELRAYTPLGTILGVTDENGSYTYNLTIPPSMKDGLYTILVSTFPLGIFAPAKASRSFTVYRLKTDHRVSIPRVIFTGIPFTVEAYTKTNSTITISLKEFNLAYSSRGLHSSKTFTLPLTYLSGSVTISVDIKPDSPKYRSAHETSKISVINIFAILVPTASLLAFSTMLFRRRVEARPVEKPSEELGVVMMRKPLSGVQALFFEIIALIGRFSGIAIKPHDTLREYLSKVESKLHVQFRDAVKRVFDLYERFIYGRPKRGLRETLSKAISKLLEDIKKVLKT
ncbi:hypothetical protein DRJ16_05160, partial [Candidatus Woesearchaeota archaeon]